VARWGYKRMADLRVSTTDPDASPMHQKKGSSGGGIAHVWEYVAVDVEGKGNIGVP
jgi:hypothetical protein